MSGLPEIPLWQLKFALAAVLVVVASSIVTLVLMEARRMWRLGVNPINGRFRHD